MFLDSLPSLAEYDKGSDCGLQLMLLNDGSPLNPESPITLGVRLLPKPIDELVTGTSKGVLWLPLQTKQKNSKFKYKLKVK